MSVIQNARYLYKLYFARIANNKSEQNLDLEAIDRQIASKILKDNPSGDLSFNIIYWGSPQANRLPSGERINYVLKIFKERSLASIQQKKERLIMG